MSGDRIRSWWHEDYTAPPAEQKAQWNAARRDPQFLVRLAVLNQQRAEKGWKPYSVETAPIAEVQSVSWYDVRAATGLPNSVKPTR